MRVVGKIFKYAFILLIISVFLLFFARCALMEFPKRAGELFPSDGMKQAYAAGGISVFTQEEIDERITSDGHFTTYAMRYVPATGELIITVRYNDGTLKDLAEKYEFDPAKLDVNAEYFDYSLLHTDGSRIAPDAVESFRQWRYSYRRLRFSGIDLSDSELRELALEIYYNGSAGGKDDLDEDGEKKSFGTCFAYHCEWELKEYELTPSDISQLTK